MSASVPLLPAITITLAGTVTFASSCAVLTVMVWPSTAVILPASRTPWGCCAMADVIENAATSARPAKVPILLI